MNKMNATPKVGDQAPDFSTIAVGGSYESGTPLTLAELKGKLVVLYFYPKDDTPGCTTQACGIRDSWKEIRATGAELFGVSIDPIKAHEKFISKFDLQFPLLADTEKSLVEAYGVWIEKSMYGKKYMGTERTTFILDRQGKIAAIFPKVKPSEHIDLLLKALLELNF